MNDFVKPNVFISACIEYESCRYDGEMIKDEFISRLAPFVNVIRVCPELAIGMSAPRDAVRLVQRKNEDIKMLSSTKGVDYTEKMVDFTERYVDNLLKKDIDGFVMKAKSPTCGITNVKVYRDIGKAPVLTSKGSGIFGGKIVEKFPDIPVETERRLSNYVIRDRFYIQLFAYSLYRSIKKECKMKDLVAFHSDYKYLFMTYNQNTMREMGVIVANHKKLLPCTVFEQYEVKLKELLSKESSLKKRINVLTHIYGYFKNRVTSTEKEYYFEVLDDYLQNKIPYSSVLTVLYGWAIRFEEDYLIRQRIFKPYPKELITVTDSGKSI